MIKTFKVDVQAANPQLPLGPFDVFVGSDASFTIINVPKAIGKREITGVAVAVTNVAEESASVQATRVGSAWTATVKSADLGDSGFVGNGVIIMASGTDENGAPAEWILGAGDLTVMMIDGAVAPGEHRVTLHLFDEAPTSPSKGDVAPFEGVYRLYNGTEWRGFGGDVRHSDFTDITDLTAGDSTGVIKEKVNMLIHRLKGISSALALAFIFPLIALGDLTPETIHDDIPGTATIAEIVEAGGGGGGGAVSSVNGKIGEVVLNADDVGARRITDLSALNPILSNLGIEYWDFPSAFLDSLILHWNENDHVWRGSKISSPDDVYECQQLPLIGGTDIIFGFKKNGVTIAMIKNSLYVNLPGVGQGRAATTLTLVKSNDGRLARVNDIIERTVDDIAELARYPLQNDNYGNWYGCFVDGANFAALDGKRIDAIILTTAPAGAHAGRHYVHIFKLTGSDATKLNHWTLYKSTYDLIETPVYDANDPSTYRQRIKISPFTFESSAKYMVIFGNQPYLASGSAFARRAATAPIPAESGHGIVTNWSIVNNSVDFRDDIALQIGFGQTISRANLVATVNGRNADSSNNVNLAPDDIGAYSKIEIDTAMNVLEDEIPTVASNVVRQCSWGVWDENYEVYWSPVMESGKLTYQAITNINLRANGEVNQ